MAPFGRRNWWKYYKLCVRNVCLGYGKVKTVLISQSCLFHLLPNLSIHLHCSLNMSIFPNSSKFLLHIMCGRPVQNLQVNNTSWFIPHHFGVCFARHPSVESVEFICYSLELVKKEINKSSQQRQVKEKSMMQKLPKAGEARVSISMHNVIRLFRTMEPML